MAKFNVVQKRRRAAIAERKRAIQGDPLSNKLKQKRQPLSISGKRKRKLFKQWRREQKEALQQGIQTMQDVEMAVFEGTSQDSGNKSPLKFHLKQSSRLKIKQLKHTARKNKKSQKLIAQASVEVMVE